MKVTSTTKATSLTGVSNGQAAKRPRASAAYAAGKDNVSISDKSSQLQALESAMNDTPEIDIGKIEAIKQAISDGSFSISAGRVADKMMDSAREMIAKQKV